LNIGVKKINTHEGVTVKALLNSSAMGMFMNRKMVAKHRFRLQRLERPVTVRNVDGTNNSAEAITHQVEVNMYYKSHVKRMRIDICDLRKTEIILGIPWLQAYNPEINWKTGEVQIMRCLPQFGRNMKREENWKGKKGKRVTILEEEKIVQWTVDDKKGWEKEKEVEANHRKIKEMVSKKFFKVEKSIWKGRVKKDANKKDLGSCYRSQENIQTIKGKNLPSIQK